MLTDLENSLTVEKQMKFSTKSMYRFSPHRKHVAVLPRFLYLALYVRIPSLLLTVICYETWEQSARCPYSGLLHPCISFPSDSKLISSHSRLTDHISLLWTRGQWRLLANSRLIDYCYCTTLLQLVNRDRRWKQQCDKLMSQVEEANQQLDEYKEQTDQQLQEERAKTTRAVVSSRLSSTDFYKITCKNY